MGDEDARALEGQVFASRYQMERLVGAGAMGRVYRARHVRVRRTYAIKLLHPRLLESVKLRKRFQREAEIAGTLHHANIASVVDAGEADGLHFIVMEYAEGPTLAEVMVEGALPAPRALRLLQQLCDGLQHAHDRGLIHRDFKPDNVIVETSREGREVPRIIDFGIAILNDPDDDGDRERLTTAGLVLGTPHYMAPEQARGASIDHRIDLFALGVVSYEMLAGCPPFAGDAAEVVRANLAQPTPPMRDVAPNVDVDPLLEAFTRQLMMKRPENRPPTARAARELLDLIERDRGAAAAALGVTLDVAPVVSARGSARRPVQQTTIETSDTIPVPVISAPIAKLSAPIPVHLTQPEVTELVRAPRRHEIAAWLAIAGSLAMACILVIVATRPDAPAVPVAPPTASGPAVAAIAAATPLTPPAATTAATPPPAPPVATPTPPARTARKPAPSPPPPRPHVLEEPRTRGIDELPSEPSARALLELYVTTGRALRELGDARWPPMTDLWARYRFIRINEALVTASRRADTERALNDLMRDIAAVRPR